MGLPAWYAMSGTDIAYGATQAAKETGYAIAGTVLRICYEMSGYPVMTGTAVGHLNIPLRIRYAMSATEIHPYFTMSWYQARTMRYRATRLLL
eukprot:2437743-Rhodomonas_salina.1